MAKRTCSNKSQNMLTRIVDILRFNTLDITVIVFDEDDLITA